MTYQPKHQPPYMQQPPQGPITYDEPPQYNPSSGAPPTPHAKLNGVWLYLTILATVYVIASLVLGVISYAAIRSNTRTMQSNARTIEQLQTDTNDNLCNQQAYQGGTNCQGGDANGGSILP
jgi:hypothetical protein